MEFLLHANCNNVRVNSSLLASMLVFVAVLPHANEVYLRFVGELSHAAQEA
jgi:hypothetical protein